MSYRIEYVREAEPKVVCHALVTNAGTLEEVEEEGYARSEVPRVLYGATGFEIHDTDADDKVVASVRFDA
jgi:hypothetical protein